MSKGQGGGDWPGHLPRWDTYDIVASGQRQFFVRFGRHCGRQSTDISPRRPPHVLAFFREHATVEDGWPHSRGGCCAPVHTYEPPRGSELSQGV